MTLTEFNGLILEQAKEELLKCCGSMNWLRAMLNQRPFSSKEEVEQKATQIWMNCDRNDYLEAFSHHPKIGDLDSLKEKFASTSDWASQEQGNVASAQQSTLEDLALANDQYLEKFGYIFIICATGKSASEMLAILQERLNNEPEEEIGIAMREQLKITIIRLNKLLS